MRRFTNILFVHDPTSKSTSALDRAVRLAKENKAKLTVLAVAEELPRTMPNLEKAVVKLHEDQLSKLLEKAGGKDLGAKIKVLIGTAFLHIIHEVLRNKHDLVIKGRNSSSSLLFGRTDLNILRKCPCPVWIIKPSTRKKYSRIIAAVDPYHQHTDGVELDHQILSLASSLAELEDSELHIVHAWNLSAEKFMRSAHSRVPKSLVDREVRDTKKTHRKLLNDLLGKFDFSKIISRVHFLKGQPENIIISLADKKRAELIVMGTVARTGVSGLFIGNTAEKVLAKVDCSVLALKPRSFVTPVKS